ncbi:MAG: DUF1549 domain-containing protein, partial [Planctomycetota bacterium]
LDLVRYAETLGHEFDFEVPKAWRYRDYVSRACRDDVPFDQFVREHVAGDLLPVKRLGDGGADESVQATAAFWFVEQTHSPVDAAKHEADRVDNQVDVLGKAFLGLTIACARCRCRRPCRRWPMAPAAISLSRCAATIAAPAKPPRAGSSRPSRATRPPRPAPAAGGCSWPRR